jgi:hypothetical protein
MYDKPGIKSRVRIRDFQGILYSAIGIQDRRFLHFYRIAKPREG